MEHMFSVNSEKTASQKHLRLLVKYRISPTWDYFCCTVLDVHVQLGGCDICTARIRGRINSPNSFWVS